MQRPGRTNLLAILLVSVFQLSAVPFADGMPSGCVNSFPGAALVPLNLGSGTLKIARTLSLWRQRCQMLFVLRYTLAQPFFVLPCWAELEEASLPSQRDGLKLTARALRSLAGWRDEN